MGPSISKECEYSLQASGFGFIDGVFYKINPDSNFNNKYKRLEYRIEFFNERNGSSYWELYKTKEHFPYYICEDDEIFLCEEWYI